MFSVSRVCYGVLPSQGTEASREVFEGSLPGMPPLGIRRQFAWPEILAWDVVGDWQVECGQGWEL